MWRAVLVAVLSLLSVVGCSSAPKPTMPTFAQSYVLTDSASTEATAKFSNIVDARTNVLPSRVRTARGVVFGNGDFQTPPLEAVRAEFLEFARTQWSADEKVRALASRPVQLVDFTLTYAVGPPDDGRADLSLGPGVAAVDLLFRAAMGQIGDFRLTVAVVVDGQKFSATELARFGANGGVVPSYASRELVKRAVREVAAKVSADNARK